MGGRTRIKQLLAWFAWIVLLLALTMALVALYQWSVVSGDRLF